jgi:peptidoglycan/xylan/chitin deacetylase (PgdA/CDA1 family)
MRLSLLRRHRRDARLSTSRLGVVLVYHRLGEVAGDARYELVPALATRLFEAQLDYLRANYRVVPPSRLLDAALERRRGDAVPVAITFDDDLRSHIDVAAPALRRAGLPAGFFLCGASVDAAHRFWWEDLQALVERPAAVPARLRSLQGVDLGPALGSEPGALHEVAELIERLPPRRRDAVAAELRSNSPVPPAGLTARQIGQLARAGFEIGFHTRSHYLLSTLDAAELRDAMNEGKERLEAVVGRELTMIAYPHGKADARVAEAARAAGYRLGFTGDPRPVGPPTDRLLIGRSEPPAAPPDDFGRAVAATLARRPG